MTLRNGKAILRNSCLLLPVLVCAVLVTHCSLPGNDGGTRQETIVFLGDSITEAGTGESGFITLLAPSVESKFPKRRFNWINAGIAGHRVPDCLKRLEKDVIARKPTLVVVYIGVNDVWKWREGKGTTKGEFEQGLRTIVTRLRKTGARVILATPAVIGESYDRSNREDVMLDEYSSVIREISEDTGVRLVDLRREFGSYLEVNNTENRSEGILTTDGIHLNARGNKFLAGLFEAPVSEILESAKQ